MTVAEQINFLFEFRNSFEKAAFEKQVYQIIADFCKNRQFKESFLEAKEIINKIEKDL